MKMSLEISRHVVSEHWMRTPEIVQLFTVLQGNIPDEQPQALFVGGCVRNVILGVPVEDLDLATPLLPDEITAVLESTGIKVIPTGLKHGTVTAILGNQTVEITTLRHDRQTDGRHAEVSFTDSWIEDAQRRDFTMNTLLMDVVGNVYDPLGKGLSDLDARKVCFVGQPKKRIEEDHLRILRFFRFSALYGDGFDEVGLQSCKASAEIIKKLSKERITQEFFKILASENPQDVLRVMFDNDVLEGFEFPEYDEDFLSGFCRFQKQYRLQALSTRLFVFSGLNLGNIKAMEQFILFPKVFLKDMKAVRGALALSDLSCDSAVRESIYRFGRSITAQAIMVELMQDRVTNRYASEALAIVQSWEIPTFPLSGDDLVAQGIEQGPELGKALRGLENWWIDQDFIPERDLCLSKAKAKF